MKTLNHKTLSEVFGIDLQDAAELYAKVRSARTAEKGLTILNKALGGFGVEYIESNEDRDVSMYYVNMGDTYDDTVIYDFYNGEFYITSWGNWLELYESRGYTFP